MYPYLRLASTLLKARFRLKIELEETSVLLGRVGLTDIDPFMELNHAQHLTYMEMGRWDYSYRVGFIKLMKDNNWGITVGGVSIRYRRRVPFLKLAAIKTTLLCHDGRWFYFLQEIHCNDKICSSALIKAGAVSSAGLVPATEVLKADGRADWNQPMPDWVSAWIDAEGQRPWPSRG